jgi:hypothetical protein
MPKLARMPFALKLSRIWEVYPTSDPASKVKATVLREALPKRITLATPLNGVGVGGVGVGVT